MSDNVWNYDMSQCPKNTKILVKMDTDEYSIAELMHAEIEQCFVFKTSLYSMCLSANDIRAWALYTPPSEPEIWIKHDDNSFPKCLPMDIVKVRREYSNSVEEGTATSFNWGYPTVSGSRILEYCIIEKHKNDRNI